MGGSSQSYLSDVTRDMYDGGNRLSTNLNSGELPYNYFAENSNSSHFGAGSSYTTFYGDSFWMMTVQNTQAETFTINGNNGADGGGSMHAYSFERNGFTVFVKQVYGQGDPSINHLIITPGTGSHSHTYSTIQIMIFIKSLVSPLVKTLFML